MHQLIEQLEQDHHHMLKMMYLFAQIINQLSLANCSLDIIDRALVILDDIQGYPETWHHPTEDTLFGYLLSKQHINAKAIYSLIDEHPRLEAQSTKLLQIYRKHQTLHSWPSQQTLELSRYFCRKQIAHIHAERNIFDAIRQRFTPQDWHDIATQIVPRPSSAHETPAIEVQQQNHSANH